MADNSSTLGPVDGRLVPRFAGSAGFARLPSRDEVDRCDVVVLGVPFDAGTSYRPGTRFGPQAIRQGSRLLRSYNPAQGVAPFAGQQVADGGDVVCNPFSIEEAITQIQAHAEQALVSSERFVALGGDHTVALPLLRAVRQKSGPVGLVHFDAHLDTWDTYFGAPYTHGTPFRRAWEEELLLPESSVHIGVRGPLYSRGDLDDDARMGFSVITANDVAEHGIAQVVDRVRALLGDSPVYVSVDIDCLDPAFAPGTGTPEAGGLQSRELLAILRGMRGLRLVGADVVEVSPPYDHAEITSIAAAHVAYELISLTAAKTPVGQEAEILVGHSAGDPDFGHGS